MTDEHYKLYAEKVVIDKVRMDKILKEEEITKIKKDSSEFTREE